MSATAPRVLVVEDEWLVAADMEDALTAAGCQVVGPAPTVEAALKLLEGAQVDAAVLDVNLGGERTYPIAELLMARGTSFVFVSGFAPSDLPEPFRTCRLLCKPVASERVLDALGLPPAP